MNLKKKNQDNLLIFLNVISKLKKKSAYKLVKYLDIDILNHVKN